MATIEILHCISHVAQPGYAIVRAVELFNRRVRQPRKPCKAIVAAVEVAEAARHSLERRNMIVLTVEYGHVVGQKWNGSQLIMAAFQRIQAIGKLWQHRYIIVVAVQ